MLVPWRVTIPTASSNFVFINLNCHIAGWRTRFFCLPHVYDDQVTTCGPIEEVHVAGKTHTQASWWFQPIWTILVKLDHFRRDRGENNKCLKPPPGSRIDLTCNLKNKLMDGFFWNMHEGNPSRMVADLIRKLGKLLLLMEEILHHLGWLKPY